MILRTTLVSRGLRLVPLAALVAAGGCFATRNDVRVVQADLANVRTEMLRAAADNKESLAQAMRTLALANDSVRAMSNRMTGLSGDVRAGLRTVNEQLILVQQLLKQNEAVIQQFRQQADRPAYVPPVTPVNPPLTAADSAAVNAPPVPTASAGQLYSTARNQYARGSYSTARMGFQQLVDQFPTSPDAPLAQLGIAQTWESEKNIPSAIAAYGAVIAKYPDAPASATARYKLAGIFIQQNKPGEAIPLLQQIVDRFKTSNEYDLAKSQLETLKRPPE